MTKSVVEADEGKAAKRPPQGWRRDCRNGERLLASSVFQTRPQRHCPLVVDAPDSCRPDASHSLKQQQNSALNFVFQQFTLNIVDFACVPFMLLLILVLVIFLMSLYFVNIFFLLLFVKNRKVSPLICASLQYSPRGPRFCPQNQKK